MNFDFFDMSLESKYDNEIIAMLKAADNEFVPPISARNPKYKEDLSSFEKNDEGVLLYFREVKKEKILIAEEDGKVLGFVSYKINYTDKAVLKENLPNIYISTLIVKPEARGKNLTRRMYDQLFDKYNDIDFYTRTWSTNAAHIKILEGFKFGVLRIIENDRGAGIDTIYFVKKHSAVD